MKPRRSFSSNMSWWLFVVINAQCWCFVFSWLSSSSSSSFVQHAFHRQQQGPLLSLSLSSPSSPLPSPSSQTEKSTTNTQQQEEEQEKKQQLRELYPPTAVKRNGTLQVDRIHTLYYEVHHGGGGGGGEEEDQKREEELTSSNSINVNKNSKKKKKKSALFLHGGPGAGCNPTHARFFNPNLYDTIVLFDQRGCGKSDPRGQIYNNTVHHLIEDCEALRIHILGQDGIWDTIFGGSWGSTLAIAYAQEYPNSIKSIILRGVCLLRTSEVDWLFTPQGKPAQMNPQGWNNFAQVIVNNMQKKEENNDVLVNGNINGDNKIIDRTVLHGYYDRLFGKNATERWNAARGWMMWEFTVSSSYKEKLINQSTTTASEATTSTANTSSKTDDETNNNNTNQTNNKNDPGQHHQSPAVLVSSANTDIWSYQDAEGNIIPRTEATALGLMDNPVHFVDSKLRQGLPYSSIETDPTPRPMVMKIHDFEEAKQEQVGNFSGFPAMPMLTCFYSVNNQYAMNHLKLLDPERMERISHIPCIAVQGGRDPICPPDTALDLKMQWSNMELRIPVDAGHSMYHPELTHELVQATDRMAELYNYLEKDTPE